MFTARDVFQFDIFASLGGELSPAEMGAVEALRLEREVCANYYRAYTGGRFADGSRLYATTGRKLAVSERTGIARYVATHGSHRETFEVAS
jgi:hypothetical protein